MLECMATMAALAGRTRRIKFGVNVISLAMRDPVLLAKQCATIDFLSDGRLLPGFGIGSPRGPEWKALHLDTTTRGRVTDEALEIIHRLWTEDSVDFDGQPLPPDRRLDLAQAGAARSAHVDRRQLRRGDPAHRALRHRLAGRIGDAGGARRRWSPPSAPPRSRPAGRIDDDHYGAASRSASARPTIPA